MLPGESSVQEVTTPLVDLPEDSIDPAEGFVGHARDHINGNEAFVDFVGTDFVEKEAPFDWSRSFYHDVYGYLGIHQEYENYVIRAQGHKLWTCHWQRFASPVNMDGVNSGPLLLLTTPEGEDFYLEDLTYYPGATSWADLDDEEE